MTNYQLIGYESNFNGYPFSIDKLKYHNQHQVIAGALNYKSDTLTPNAKQIIQQKIKESQQVPLL